MPILDVFVGKIAPFIIVIVAKMHKNQNQPLTLKNLPPCHFVLQCPIIFNYIY